MQIESMFKYDINRDIEGVIKVQQSDEAAIEQELREYVITRELRGHFSTFFENYDRALDVPTGKMGVWISGFFGSGKSHFLKILSYLLENKIIANRHAIDYFRDKFDDPMMIARIERACSVHTETILFNIDSKSPINKDKTAILRVFAKVFYDHLGFYGSDLKVAKLEQFIFKQGKYDAFKQAFEQTNGAPWDEARDAFSFFEDDVVDVLQQVLGMTETAARNWFNGEESGDLSIEQLVKEIKEYVDSKGKRFRLLFMIDEVGQYIGSDSDLMLNLQTIVEDLGGRCNGKVWVMVTSQEAIDSITRIAGDDFSKIQGRFNTRLSLSSSSVDEVIKKRILAKDDHAQQLLAMEYEREHAVLKNLFTFRDAMLDVKGYTGAQDFAETYPFVPYQFRLMQDVLAQIRKHGNSGKHLSGGERSMLSGFQEAAQKVRHLQEDALVPFHLFYDTIITFLESVIRRVIVRCETAAENHDGIEPLDVSVLKLLYLVRYVDDVKANVDNIATLMVDNIGADKIELRRRIAASLDRLLSQNYIARSGDNYTFLTDDEQDIARDIRSTPVDNSAITAKIAEIVYGGLYTGKKFRYEKYDFAYDQFVDEQVFGSLSGAMRLRILTPASPLYDESEQRLIMKSGAENEAIVKLSGEFPYYKELEEVLKVQKYGQKLNLSQRPEAIRRIIEGRQQQAREDEAHVKENLEKAIAGATCYVGGARLDLKSGSAKDKLDQAMSALVEGVYTKLGYIGKHCDADEDILHILSPKTTQTDMALIDDPNIDAINEVQHYLEVQHMKQLQTSMGDVQKRFQGIPYGWREIDIAAVVAKLIAAQKISVKYAGSTIQPNDRRLPDYLRRRGDVDKTMLTKRIILSESVMKQARELLREYFGVMDLPADEDGLIRFVIQRFEQQRADYQRRLDTDYQAAKYPDRQAVESAIAQIDAVLAKRQDNHALLSALAQKQDELRDLQDDMAEVDTFFSGNQRQIYDSAARTITAMAVEKDYLGSKPEITEALRTASDILAMPKPYLRIAELPQLMQQIDGAYGELLQGKRAEVLGVIEQAMGDAHTVGSDPHIIDIVRRADAFFSEKKAECQSATSITVLDSLIMRIHTKGREVMEQIERALDDKAKMSGKKIRTARRLDVFPARRIETEADIDAYIKEVRRNLTDMLNQGDDINLI